MCGRYSLGLNRGQIHQVRGWGHDLEVGEWVDEQNFYPRHNIAPRSNGVVLRRRGAPDTSGAMSDTNTATSALQRTTSRLHASNTTHASSDAMEESHPEFILQTMRWGLIPHWAQHEDKTLSTSNARAEALVDGGGMWVKIKGKKRCVVLCEGYYEWLKKGKERLPYFTRPKDNNKLMLLAGLWDCTILEDEKEPLWTFTIVTTDANKDFTWLHDRQPVILSSKAAVDAWLDTSSQQWTSALTSLVRPYTDATALLECYQVPKEVGKVGTESPTFIEPVAARKDGIKAMFAKQTLSPRKGPLPQTMKQTRSPSPSSVKHKRNETSPGKDPVDGTHGRVKQKKARVEKVDSWDDNDNIEYLGESSAGYSEAPAGSCSTSAPTSPKKINKPKKAGKSTNESSGSKVITDFFK